MSLQPLLQRPILFFKLPVPQLQSGEVFLGDMHLGVLALELASDFALSAVAAGTVARAFYLVLSASRAPDRP